MTKTPKTFIEDLLYQVRTRNNQIGSLIMKLNSIDPIEALPLTENQQWYLQGKEETWKFVEEMVSELVEKHLGNEN